MKRTPLRATNPKTIVKIKPRKCKACGELFEKRSMTHIACSTACAIALAEVKRKKLERKEIAVRKVAIKTRSDWMKDAQVAFNGFIRARDAGKPCICCGKPLPAPEVGGGFDAGHYRSVGSAPHMRFDESNVHGQTKQCNRYGAGRAVDYRIGLIKRIGLKEVELIESDQGSRKWTIEDLREITATYRAKLKELKKMEAA